MFRIATKGKDRKICNALESRDLGDEWKLGDKMSLDQARKELAKDS